MEFILTDVPSFLDLINDYFGEHLRLKSLNDAT